MTIGDLSEAESSASWLADPDALPPPRRSVAALAIAAVPIGLGMGTVVHAAELVAGSVGPWDLDPMDRGFGRYWRCASDMK